MMPDRIDQATRSFLMRRVRSQNTKPEIVVRRTAHSLGFRFRLHQKNLPGSPDIVLAKHAVAIFVHGCFWHGHRKCKRAKRPTSNTEFWEQKLDRNIQRDRAVVRKLKGLGWRVLVVWECETKDLDGLKNTLSAFMERKYPVDGDHIG